MAGSKTAETLLYNKFRREGYSVAEARRLAKLNAPYYERGRKNSARRETRVERRVRKALKKYVRRRNPGWRKTGLGERSVKASKKRWLKRGHSREDINRLIKELRRKKHENPPKVKGRKVKGGRAVTVRNFTGTIVKKADGTVQIVGKGRRK